MPTGPLALQEVVMTLRDFAGEQSFYKALEGLVVEAALGEGSSAMILPGGQTPMPLFQRLFMHRIKVSPGFRIILSDERYCPVSSPDSNQGAILPFLLKAGFAREQFLVPDMSLHAGDSAGKFNEELGRFLDGGGIIQTAVLGVGVDGHTAGIFEDMHGGEPEAYACMVSRPDGRKGITCTPGLLSKAGRIVFILRGVDKDAIVQKMMSDPAGTVAGRIGMAHGNAEIWFCSE